MIAPLERLLQTGRLSTLLGVGGVVPSEPDSLTVPQYGAHFFGDFRRKGVDLTGPGVIARGARAGHDAQTLDHEPTAHVLALRAEDGKRLTGVWQRAVLSVFTSRGGDVSRLR